MFIHQKESKYSNITEKWINVDKILFIVKKTYRNSSISFDPLIEYECYLEGKKEPITVSQEIIDELMTKTKKVNNGDKE